MAVPARLSLVTLGVSDVGRSRAFYRALGWEPVGPDRDDVCFFSMAGAHLAVFGRVDLAHDVGVPVAAVPVDGIAPDGFRGVTLALNLDDADAVDRAVEEAVAAGARVLCAPRATFWGGYSGYFADPDGHVWEVAHNPGWEIGPDARPILKA